MTEARKEALKNKIKNLLDLANSPNENEAALAAAKAQELLDKYNLSRTDLEIKGEGSIIQRVMMTTDRSQFPLWKSTMASHIETVMDVMIFIQNYWMVRVDGKMVRLDRTNPAHMEAAYEEKPKEGKEFILVGRESDIQVATYTMEYLSTIIEKLAYKELKKAKNDGRVPPSARGESVKFKTSFCLAAANRVGGRLLQAREERINADASLGAMVLASKDAVRNYFVEQIGELEGKTRTYTPHLAGYAAGAKAGADIPLSPAIEK